MVKIPFPSFLGGRAGLALFVLHAFVGIAFLFHGYGKIVDISALASEFSMPSGVAAAAYTQFVSGVMMIV